jgi:hypothetical protein
MPAIDTRARHYEKNHGQSPDQVNPSSDYSHVPMTAHQFRARKREDRFNVLRGAVSSCDHQATGCHPRLFIFDPFRVISAIDTRAQRHHGKKSWPVSKSRKSQFRLFARTDEEHQFRARKREDRFNACVARPTRCHYTPGCHPVLFKFDPFRVMSAMDPRTQRHHVKNHGQSPKSVNPSSDFFNQENHTRLVTTLAGNSLNFLTHTVVCYALFYRKGHSSLGNGIVLVYQSF